MEKLKNWQVVIITLVVAGLIGWIVYLNIGKKPEVKPEEKSEDTNILRQSFISGCVAEDGATYQVCNCAYDKLIERYGAEGFMDIALDYDRGIPLPDDAIKSVITCFQ